MLADISRKRRATRIAWLAVLSGLAVAPAASPASRPPASFAWFTASPPPAGWKTAALPSRAAVLAYPPALHRVHADPGSVSAALIDPRGDYLAYLNVTPKQGQERLATWPEFRLERLRDESARSVHEDARALDLPFRGGTGSCVIDDYVTRVKHHHYREIACFVQGSRSGDVVVAAAPPSQWSRFGALLERAVASFRIR